MGDFKSVSRETYLHLFILKDVATDPTYIKIGRLERTEPNLIHFKWSSRVNRQDTPYFKLQNSLT